MSRRSLSLLFSASMLAGCLSSYGGPQGSDPAPQAPDPVSSSGSGSSSEGGSTASSGSGSSATPDPTPAPTPTPTPTPDPTPSGPPAQTGSIALSIPSATDSLRLNDSKDYTVTVTPKDGFTGMVTYSIDNLPAGVTATFDPASAMVSTDPVTTKLTLKTASDTVPGTAKAFDIKAVSGTISATQAFSLDVTAELLVRIAKGVKIGTSQEPNKTAFGAESIPTVYVAPGTKVTFVNDDIINHEIHSDGSLGIKHEGGPLQANAANEYTQTFNAAGTFNFRCHIHPNMRGQIVVKAAPAAQ